MSSHYQFPCGCRWPILGPPPRDGALPLLDFDDENIPFCQATWKLLTRGNTKGVFQLESNLGRQWTKKVKPSSGMHIGALGALLRPGCLRAVVDEETGVTMTQRYCRVKNGEEKIHPYHPAIDRILSPTYGTLCIHEEALVAMADGRQLPINKVMVGDMIMSLNTTQKIFEPKACVRIGPTRFGDGITVTLENRFSVTVTSDHEVLSGRGFVSVSQLRPDDVIAIASTLESTPGGVNAELAPWLGPNEAVAYLLGQLVGDGSVSNSVTISCGSQEKCDILLDWFAKEIPNLRLYKYFHCRSWYLGVSCSLLLMDGIHGNRKTRFHDWLEKCDMKRSCLTKRVPSVIFSAQASIREAFLAGYFDADGHSGCGTNSINICHFCSGSPKLLQDVRHLCILSGVMTRLESGGKHLGIVNANRFWKTIGRHTLLRKPHGKICTGGRHGWIPRSMLTRPEGESYRDFCKRVGISCRPSHRQLPWVRPTIADRYGFDIGQVRFMRVRSLSPVSNQQFYGIDVAGHNNLVTNGIVIHNCFQEQAMAIATAIAGFTLMEADALRKACGKKLPEEMAKVRIIFLAGAKRLGILTEEQAEEVFGWIEKSQRYSFNASHAISYGLIGYDCAYIKAHFPVAFYTSWLRFAKTSQDPMQEVFHLVNDAKMNDVQVVAPDLRTMEPHFSTDGVVVHFGLADIRGIGDKQIDKIFPVIAATESLLKKKLPEWTWHDFLFFASSDMTSSTVRAIIVVGGLSWMKMPRQEMLAEFGAWNDLTPGEQRWIRERQLVALKQTSIEPLLPDLPIKPTGKAGRKTWETKSAIYEARKKELVEQEKFVGLSAAIVAVARLRKNFGGASSETRCETLRGMAYLLDHPSSPRHDRPDQIAWDEEQNLGVPVTCSRVDAFDQSDVNTTCKEFVGGKTGYMVFGVSVEQVREGKTKKGRNPGQKMAFVTMSDSTCSLSDVICFPDVWREFSGLLVEGNCVIVQGDKDTKQGSLLIKRVSQMQR